MGDIGTRYQKLKGETKDYVTSLAFLSRLLKEYYQKPVIILIDEYDVPLENAYFAGFYQKMVDFIRSLFESALKTNPSLHFAVITGCLRITKESIFTGLNNLESISIMDKNYDEHFGFTQNDIDQILQDYQISFKKELLCQWYDGYSFGNTDIYNPWSIINYVLVPGTNVPWRKKTKIPKTGWKMPILFWGFEIGFWCLLVFWISCKSLR